MESTKYYSELLPADKVAKVEELLERKAKKRKLAFVGDGINDAPVLSRADIGIAMGALGSDAAIEAADVVLMDDDPLKISKAIQDFQKMSYGLYMRIFTSPRNQDHLPVPWSYRNCEHVDGDFRRCGSYGDRSLKCDSGTFCKESLGEMIK